MSTRTQTQRGTQNTNAATQSSSAEKVLGFAVMGCLLAGFVGVFMAMSMHSGIDVLLCLLGSVAAFGLVFHIYLGRD